MDTRPNNLPLQLSSFIGREREIAETRHALESSRLVTLTGAGGSGKTRLALEVAAGLQDVFTDGVWFVDFAPLSDPALVAPKLAATLTIPEASSQVVLTSVISSFLDKRALFVFDNCEHLIDACAQLTETLLQSCVHLRVLATSREAFRLTGELVLPVPPLSSPDPRHVQPPEALMRFDAVQLFTDRARAVRPAFALTDQNAEEVARVCHRLDGIPLALELAAAHVGASSVKQIADRLDDRFQLLTGGHRTAVPRQRTLRATVQWSFDLLSESERVLFRRLSVFAGGCTVAAAEAVAADESLPAPDMFIALTQLVNKSLVLAEERDGATRYRMLETIRQYADELLRNCAELRPIRDRHLRCMLLLAEQAEPYFHGTREMPEWLDRLETEHDNIRAALAWCEAESRTETGLALATALWWFWTSHSHLREGQDWLKRMLKQADGLAVLLRARALQAASWLTLCADDFTGALPLANESLALFQAAGDKMGMAWSFNILGILANLQHDNDTARSFFRDSLAIGRSMGDAWTVFWTLANEAEVTYLLGLVETAISMFAECLSTARAAGHAWGIASVTRELGDIAFAQGDYVRASDMYTESAEQYHKLGNKVDRAHVLRVLGHVMLQQHDDERALALYQESFALAREAGDPAGIAACLTALAGVANAQGQSLQAVHLLSFADAMLESRRLQLVRGDYLYQVDQISYDRNVNALAHRLSESTFAQAWAEGRVLTREQAFTEASQVTVSPQAVSVPAPTSKSIPLAYPAGLSGREVDVLRLVASGLTNADIAERLVISPRTVNAHLRSIYGKLGVTTRTAAARFATENKLV